MVRKTKAKNYYIELERSLKGTLGKEREEIFLKNICPIIESNIKALYQCYGWKGFIHWVDNNLKWVFTDIKIGEENYEEEFHERSSEIVEVMRETNNGLIEDYFNKNK